MCINLKIYDCSGINTVSRVDGANLPGTHGFDWVGTNLPHGQSGSCDPDTEVVSMFFMYCTFVLARNTFCLQTVADMAKQCFLYNGSTVVQQPINVAELSEKINNDAKTFIRANEENPFFLYLAFPQVHHALFCKDDFCDKSARGKSPC